MADIFVGDVGDILPTNTSDVFVDGGIDFQLLGDRADNDPAIIYGDGEIAFELLPNRVDNLSVVYNVGSIDFVLFANRGNNTSIVYAPPLVDILTLTLLPSAANNTNIVYNGTQSSRILPTSFNNSFEIYPATIIQDAVCKPDLSNNNSTVYPATITFVDIPIVGTLIERTKNNSTVKKDYVFSDFAMDFVPHPISGDVAILYDVTAINQSLHNILLTKKFERPFDNYNVSSQIRSLLFSLSDNMLAVELKSEIFQVIVNYEPRINIVDIVVEATPQKHELYVKLFYRIKTFENVEVFKTLIS